MRSLLAPSAALLIATVGVAFAAEELKSGLQVGDRTSALQHPGHYRPQCR